MDRYSDGNYLHENPDWHDADAAWKAAHIVALIQSAGLQPRTLCDVGCGAGGILAELRRGLPETTLLGLDVSPQAVELARKQHPDVDIRLAELPRSEERFDLLLLLDVFEHIEDYLGFLRSLREYAPHFIFHIPLDMAAQLVIRSKPLLTKRRQVGHLHYFSKDTALASLTTAGYRVDRWRYTAGSLDAPDRTLGMRMLASPRRLGRMLAPDFTANVLGGFSLLVLASPAASQAIEPDR